MRTKKKFNKRGQETNLLPEETLKLIIAVICIVALIALVAALYFALSGNQSVKFAQAIASRFANETKRINVGEISDTTLPVPNPSGWYIFSFVGQDIKPNSCAGANCLCVCEKLLVGIINTDLRQVQRCDSKDGTCAVITNLKKFDAIQIKNGGIFVSIKSVNGQIQINKV